MGDGPHFEKVLEISQSALDREIGVLEAARTLFGLVQAEPAIANKEDQILFVAIESETDNLPIGDVRNEWHPDRLIEKDREIAKCETIWGARVLAACERIRRTALLWKLIVRGHLNVYERQLLGKVNRDEVARILKQILFRNGIFPEIAREGAVYEGACIERSSSGARITWRRAYPWDPTALAESRTQDFPNIDSAVEVFMDSEWKPGIDGIALAPTRQPPN